MSAKITKKDIIDFVKEGGRFFGTLALDIYGDSLNKAGEQAFAEAIEIGIENTIASLYDTKVDDKEIIRVVSKHWGICDREVEDRLVWEKHQAAISDLSISHKTIEKWKAIGFSEYEKYSLIFMITANELFRLRYKTCQLDGRDYFSSDPHSDVRPVCATEMYKYYFPF